MLIQTQFSQKFPSYRDMAFYEMTRRYAPHVDKPCRSFRIRDDHQDVAHDKTLYQQLTWLPEDVNKPVIKPVHFIVNDDYIPELLDAYGDAVQEIGVTRAFGHTLSISHIGRDDQDTLDQQLVEIQNGRNAYIFILNSFDTCEGSDELIQKMGRYMGESHVEAMLCQEQNFSVLKVKYTRELSEQSELIRQQEIELKIAEYADVLTKPLPPEDVFNNYGNYIALAASGKHMYAKQVVAFQNGTRLLQGICP